MQITPAMRKIAARQHGLVTREQLAPLGVSTRSWERANRAGLLVAVAPRVARLPGAAPTPEQRILGAVLHCGPGALASHASSAWLWGIGVASTEWVDVIFADRNRRVRLPGVRTHTPTDVDDLRPLRRSGIPTTNPLRVLVDLGQVQPDAVGDTLRHFLVEGLVSRSAVRASLGRHGRKGRHGVRVLRAAFQQWAIDDKPPDSELERVMAQLLGGHQLPLAEFHAHILGFEVDFALAVGRVIVECDGWDAHGRNPVQFERDRRRDAELVAAGWVVLRFTWLQITRRPAWVADVLRRTLRARPAA